MGIGGGLYLGEAGTVRSWGEVGNSDVFLFTWLLDLILTNDLLLELVLLLYDDLIIDLLDLALLSALDSDATGDDRSDLC